MHRPVTAIVFPGQGSQTSDMRAAVARELPDLLELAEAEVPALFERVEEGTRFAQPAIYCAGLAGWSRTAAQADLYAGHSLGEMAALAAAGALSIEDGLGLVTLRGRLMQEAGTARAGDGMIAVLGPNVEADPSARAERHGLAVANDNAPGQVVLSGAAAGLDAARVEAETEGLRVVRLPVTGAFHSPAMAPAVPEYEAALRETAFTDPDVPVLSGVTAAPFDDVRRRLAESLTRPVRWREVLLALRDRGAARVIETGPGRVLTGLARRTLDGVETVTVDRLEAARA